MDELAELESLLCDRLRLTRVHKKNATYRKLPIILDGGTL